MTNLYATARQMLDDLGARRISARELLDAHFARNEMLAKKLNAVIETDIEAARKIAQTIDDARARGEVLGPLAGLPMTIKDGFDLAGMPASVGNPALKNRARDCADSEMAARAKKAGAVFWGKTNVPFMLGDFQSYNAIYGTTNNPYDMTRVPGGSSGGAAAALAAGITPLEIGSDIGGSLRHPANFCGVCSLKPTWGVLSQRGHIPPLPQHFSESDLGVVGPMARNVGDLKLLWSVLSGTPIQKPRNIGAARIAVWDTEAGWPLAAEVRGAVTRAADALSNAGANVEHAKPEIDGAALMDAYRLILNSILNPNFTGSYSDLQRADAARNAMKDRLAAFYDDGWDAILMPVSIVPPFKHLQEPKFSERMLDVDGKSVPYGTMLDWISLATALHTPALAVPAGRTKSRLPVGVQLVGPRNGEDRLFDFAAAVEEGLGGFVPPAL